MKWNNILPWLVPVIMAMLIGGAKLYEVIDVVDAIKIRQDTSGKKAIQELGDLKWRVRNIERYCCQNSNIKLEYQPHETEVAANK
jgi:hypothetical protein